MNETTEAFLRELKRLDKEFPDDAPHEIAIMTRKQYEEYDTFRKIIKISEGLQK